MPASQDLSSSMRSSPSRPRSCCRPACTSTAPEATSDVSPAKASSLNPDEAATRSGLHALSVVVLCVRPRLGLGAGHVDFPECIFEGRRGASRPERLSHVQQFKRSGRRRCPRADVLPGLPCRAADGRVRRPGPAPVRTPHPGAAFPWEKSPQAFDFDANPNGDPATVNTLATCEWVKKGEPLCLIGDSGTGKSHLLIALGRKAAMQGFRVRYVLAAKLVNEPVEAADEKQLRPSPTPALRGNRRPPDLQRRDHPDRHRVLRARTHQGTSPASRGRLTRSRNRTDPSGREPLAWLCFNRSNWLRPSIRWL